MKCHSETQAPSLSHGVALDRALPFSDLSFLIC